MVREKIHWWFLYWNEKNKCIKNFELPNTLGGYYSTFTEFFGFKSNSEEEN